MSGKSYEIDMCNGPLPGKIFKFALPLIFSSILQLLFNAADVIVVGRFAGDEALAAVGSTGALVHMLINFAMGMSVGANVIVSRALGAKDARNANDAVHTAILLSLLFGCILGAIGIIFAYPILNMMSFPPDVIDLSALYIKIYFAGLPSVLLYNYGSAILRAIGDTKRPLYILSISGVVNVLLNLIFVIKFHMSVAGVALATIISQILSAILILKCLGENSGLIKFEFKKLKIHKHKLLQILKIGLPAGFQSMMFSISNIVVQSAINTFESAVMAGNAAASNIEAFVYAGMNAFYQTTITFTGQNIGAGKYRRIPKIFKWCCIYSTAVGAVLSLLVMVFATPLLRIYTTSDVVVQAGIARFNVICAPYIICGIMDITVGLLRGMGHSILPMIISVVCVCGLRVLWIATVFQIFRTQTSLYMAYPVTWVITIALNAICIAVCYKKLLKKEK